MGTKDKLTTIELMSNVIDEMLRAEPRRNSFTEEMLRAKRSLDKALAALVALQISLKGANQ